MFNLCTVHAQLMKCSPRDPEVEATLFPQRANGKTLVEETKRF